VLEQNNITEFEYRRPPAGGGRPAARDSEITELTETRNVGGAE
jgi:hypothetical protein